MRYVVRTAISHGHINADHNCRLRWVDKASVLTVKVHFRKQITGKCITGRKLTSLDMDMDTATNKENSASLEIAPKLTIYFSQVATVGPC